MSQLALSLIKECIYTRSTYLDLGCCGLTDDLVAEGTKIDIALRKCTHLKTLILSNEWYDWEKEEWFDSPNTREMNFFATHPPALPLLKDLEVLRCGGDSSKNWGIKDMGFVDSLRALVLLDISFNQISELKGLDKLTHLQLLDIRNNQISELKGLDTLTHLQLLDIRNNQISELKGLDTLTHLQLLDIRNNQISELKGLDTLTHLQQFYISSNQISELKGLEQLNNLQQLSILSNEISELKGLDKLTHLQQLDVAFNQINELKGLNTLTNLQKLNISHNQISDIRPLLPFMQRAENPLQVKWDWFPNIGEIGIEDNPLTSPPVEIVKQGNAAILRYFERKEKGVKEIFLYEAKMVLVGEGATGKTTLRKKLLDPKAKMPPKNARTRGIDVSPYVFRYDEKDYTAHIWDFGGQDIYYSIHRFFMSDNAVYVLMSQSRNDMHNFDYWLPNIRLFAGSENPILMVRNLIKGFKGENMSISEYKGEFKICGDLFEIDLSKVSDALLLENLQRELHHRVSLLPQIRKPIFENWLEVRNYLKEEVKSQNFYISYQRFVEICKMYDVKDIEVIDLGRYLHNLGIILWYHEKEKLKEMVILEPAWVTSAVYKVIDDKKIEDALGHFEMADLQRIWKKEQYLGKVAELLMLMKHFKICYERIDVKNSFIIPVRLPAEMPIIAQQWEYKESVCIEYRYTFMPKGIVNQMTAQLHEFIKNNENAWNKGVILFHEETQSEALIKEDTIRRNVLVSVKGAMAQQFLGIIMREMKHIHRDYPGILFERIIPCPCNKCKTLKKPFEFSYDKLVKWVNEDKNKEVHCNESNTKFLAMKLLSGVGREAKEEKREGDIYIGNLIQGDKNMLASQIENSRIGIKIDETPDFDEKMEGIHGELKALHRRTKQVQNHTKNIQHSLSHLKSDLLAQIGIESEAIKAAISQSSEKQVEVMGEMLRELEKMDNETQQQLWDGFCALGMKNEAVKNIIEAEIAAAKLTKKDNSNLKLKIGLPFMLQNILGIGLEYEATLADGNAFAKWAKKWVSRI